MGMAQIQLASDDLSAFTALEQTGWEDAASIYEPYLGTFTQQAVTRLLDAVHIAERTRVLDVACGPGYAAGYAAALGARAVGLDFAPAMVAGSPQELPPGRIS